MKRCVVGRPFVHVTSTFLPYRVSNVGPGQTPSQPHTVVGGRSQWGFCDTCRMSTV